MFFINKYSSGLPNPFNNSKPFKNIELGVVQTVGKVQVDNTNNSARKRDLRFNSDPHAIRVRIIGSKYDNQLTNEDLPNCYPILPKHLNLVPKLNEVVLVFVFGEDEKYSDRFYVGPVISSPDKLNNDSINGTALSTLSISNTTPPQELDKVPTALGVYENPQNLTIEGRYNTDLIQREGEIIIRSGKFVKNRPLEYNSKNPAYIQIKTDMSYETDDGTKETDISVTNVVSNKINLLTYTNNGNTSPVDVDGNSTNIPLTKTKDNSALFISDDELDDIVKSAHPVVYGDILVDYLKLLRKALFSHAHNGHGNFPTDRTDVNSEGSDQAGPLKTFSDKAKRLEELMLSKNIRIN